jgi:hypothetical protein
VVGAARHAGALRRVPVLAKLRIKVVAAFRRFNKGEFDACLADLIPVDVALVVGDVDPLDRHGMSPLYAIMRLVVLQ